MKENILKAIAAIMRAATINRDVKEQRLIASNNYLFF